MSQVAAPSSMPADPEGDPSVAVALAASLVGAVGSVVRGKDEVVRLSVVALLAGGHLLVEDLPGTGKTLLAKSLATAIGGRFGRVQCTPDLLPSDITGTSVYAPVDGSWNFRAGPLFANVVLVDEVNRASPRTQAALLEPMEEHQVSIDGTTYGLPDPFFCIATQNPYGQIGTFPLPESQLDRFALVLSMGLPDRAAEREILTGQGGAEVLGALASVTTPDEVAAAVLAVRHVFVAPALVEYVLDLTAATRTHPELTVGASPRASTGLLHAARAHAVVAGRSHLTPDDVQAVAGAAFAHRVAVGGSVDTAAARRIIADVVARTPVPRP
ncbi:MoxR family ATPase [Aquihabitans sp. G128]|uniref:AAA family ATPase n=1 Tax=Aquihabitans sp. G128 TaxID=2849779 RepID=UPI0020B33E7E|nr:MoxR family ATPase [Aquihabitans sp. G128]